MPDQLDLLPLPVPPELELVGRFVPEPYQLELFARSCSILLMGCDGVFKMSGDAVFRPGDMVFAGKSNIPIGRVIGFDDTDVNAVIGMFVQGMTVKERQLNESH